MTVTKITEITKSRVKIETDIGDNFVLYKREVRTYGIQEDREIEGKVWNEIMAEILPKRAKLRALNLLKSRAYTEAQLADKLKTGGYPESIIEEAMAYVRSFGYVDDKNYACDFIEYNKENKSKKRIFMDLCRKGVPRDIIEEMWDETAGEDTDKLEKEQILRWVVKKRFCAETATLQEKQKMMAFLYRKGFGAAAIRSVLLLDITSI